MKTILPVLVLFLFAMHSVAGQNMNYAQVHSILQAECDSVAGEDGGWQVVYNGRNMLLIADENHNRMRLISPITSRDELSAEYLENALIANFHSALDVKYALSDDVLWSAFIHPLKELSDSQLRSALSQVYLAAETFGSSYQSTELVFPGAPAEETKPEINSPKKRKL